MNSSLEGSFSGATAYRMVKGEKGTNRRVSPSFNGNWKKKKEKTRRKKESHRRPGRISTENEHGQTKSAVPSIARPVLKIEGRLSLRQTFRMEEKEEKVEKRERRRFPISNRLTNLPSDRRGGGCRSYLPSRLREGEGGRREKKERPVTTLILFPAAGRERDGPSSFVRACANAPREKGKKGTFRSAVSARGKEGRKERKGRGAGDWRCFANSRLRTVSILYRVGTILKRGKKGRVAL